MMSAVIRVPSDDGMFVLFSKDRPLQLEACLRSLARHCGDVGEYRAVVIFKASSPWIASLYRQLQPLFSFVEWVSETDFAKDLSAAISGSEYVGFIVDDAVFVRQWTMRQCIDALATDSRALGVSLRLGRNTRICYALNVEQKVPPLEPHASGLLAFDWTIAEYDFGYPLEVSSSVYRVRDIARVLGDISDGPDVRNPNMLEAALDAAKSSFCDERPILLTHPWSVAFCVPLNVVQDVSINRSIVDIEYSWRRLLLAFDAGYRLDIEALDGYLPDACHVDVRPAWLEPSIEADRFTASLTRPDRPPLVQQLDLAGLPADERRWLRVALNRTQDELAGRWLTAMVADLHQDFSSDAAELAKALEQSRTRIAEQWATIQTVLMPELSLLREHLGTAAESAERAARDVARAQEECAALRVSNETLSESNRVHVLRVDELIAGESRLRAELSGSLAERDALVAETARLQADNARLQATVAEIRASASWRFSVPIRWGGRMVRWARADRTVRRATLGRIARRGAAFAGRLLRRIPVDEARKRRIADRVFPLAHPLLRNTATYRRWILEQQNLHDSLGLKTSRESQRELAASTFALTASTEQWQDYLSVRERLLASTLRGECGKLRAWRQEDVAQIEPIDCQRILERFGVPAGADAGRAVLIESLKIATRLPACFPSSPKKGDVDPGFSIVTPFFRHLDFFALCAESVATLIERSPGRVAEWVVVSDDPTIDPARILAVIPASIRDKIRFLPCEGRNLGIVARLNQGIQASSGDWVLFLDCDDLLLPSAVDVLTHYILEHPEVRYISSAMIDIDEGGHILRFRHRSTDSESLLFEGMTAGHLKAVRRDAFEDLGLLSEAAEGCQDFEFALRLRLKEPILFIPEFLYGYRWHADTQSVSQAMRQERTALGVLQRLIVGQAAAEHSSLLPFRVPPPKSIVEDAAIELAVIIRTMGDRLDLLRQAVDSVLLQPRRSVAVVTVHGPRERFDLVVDQFQRHDRVRVVHAGLPRRRGYPLNVALESLAALDPMPYAVAFLDDDDILYPLMSEVALDALRVSGADVVTFSSNQRVPWSPAQPAYGIGPTLQLLVGNFIPINAYVTRAASVFEAGLRFDESLEYLEDWDFLIGLIEHRFRFHAVPDVLSEFRMTGDGNAATKRWPEVWKACADRVFGRADRILQSLSRTEMLTYFGAIAADAINQRTTPEALRELRDKLSRIGDLP